MVPPRHARIPVPSTWGTSPQLARCEEVKAVDGGSWIMAAAPWCHPVLRERRGTEAEVRVA